MDPKSRGPWGSPSNPLREPFLQFLIIGGLVFGASLLWGEEPVAEREVIRVDDGVVTALDARFRATWNRPPSVEELHEELRRYVRRETLYRYGVAMGIAEGDIVIQRRVVQKLEFLAADEASAAPLEREDLERYFADHPQEFTRPGALSLRQLLFSTDTRADRAANDASALLERVRAGELADFAEISATGDSSLLPSELRAVSPNELSSTFGRDFATTLAAATSVGWMEPVRSSYGVHLVEITAIFNPRALSFEEAQAQVREAVERERREAAEQRLYERARADYELDVELSAPELAGIEL